MFTDSNFTKRIDKRVARRLFNAGQTIRIVPCKANLNHIMWQGHLFNNKTEFDGEVADFDEVVNSYTYYNCNYETGYYPAFYVEEE